MEIIQKLLFIKKDSNFLFRLLVINFKKGDFIMKLFDNEDDELDDLLENITRNDPAK